MVADIVNCRMWRAIRRICFQLVSWKVTKWRKIYWIIRSFIGKEVYDKSSKFSIRNIWYSSFNLWFHSIIFVILFFRYFLFYLVVDNTLKWKKRSLFKNCGIEMKLFWNDIVQYSSNKARFKLIYLTSNALFSD